MSATDLQLPASAKAGHARERSAEPAAVVPGPGSVSVQELGKRYGDKWVVDNLSFNVPSGSFLSIVGPSGCGKSTTLRLIAGLDRPDSGEIRIGSTSVSSESAGVSVPSERRNIGFVFQSYALWPHMTAFEHVLYPLQNRGLSRAEMSRRVQETLDIVGLRDLGPRYPSELSGGQQQRVALARAVVQEPALLLLDEPLSNLDAALRARMGVEIRSLQRRLKFTAIYVTHDRVEALSLSDQIMVMLDGKAVEHGTPRDVYEQPRDLFSARFVSGANTLRGVVRAIENGHVLVKLADGGETLRVPARSRAPAVGTGDAVWVAARPETLRIAGSDGPADANLLHGVVESVTYFGAYSDVLARIGETQVNARVEPGAVAQVEAGRPITLAFPVDALVALPAT